MIRLIVAEFVAVLTVVAMCFIMEKWENKKWKAHVCFGSSVLIVAIGCGLVQLLTGRNPISELFLGLVLLYRQHVPVFIALVALYLAVCLEWEHILCLISPRVRRWYEGDFSAETSEKPMIGSVQ